MHGQNIPFEPIKVVLHTSSRTYYILYKNKGKTSSPQHLNMVRADPGSIKHCKVYGSTCNNSVSPSSSIQF